MEGGPSGIVGVLVQPLVEVDCRNGRELVPTPLRKMVGRTAREKITRFARATRSLVQWTVSGQFGKVGAFVPRRVEVACRAARELVPIPHRPSVEHNVLGRVNRLGHATKNHVQGMVNGLHGRHGLPAQ